MGMMDDMKDKMGDMSKDQMNARIQELSNKAQTGEMTDAERDELASLRTKV